MVDHRKFIAGGIDWMCVADFAWALDYFRSGDWVSFDGWEFGADCVVGDWDIIFVDGDFTDF